MKLALTKEEIEKAEEIARSVFSLILDEAHQRHEDKVVVSINEIISLWVFIWKFYDSPDAKPFVHGKTQLLFQRIKELSEDKIDQIQYLKIAVEKYTQFFSLLENDLIGHVVRVLDQKKAS